MKRIAVVMAVLAGPLSFAEQESIPTRRAALPGFPVTAPDGVTPAEELLLAPDLAAALLALPLEGSIRLTDWPLEPGVRRVLNVTRHDVYDSDARLVAIDGEREIELPRSKLHFYWGAVEDEQRGPVVLSVDPVSGVVHGYAESETGWVELRAAGAGRAAYLVAPSIAFAAPGTPPLEFGCAQSALPESLPRPLDRSGLAPEDATLSTLHKVTLAVDTDNELMLLKFADSTTSATNYIASLFALMTAAYERDLKVRLLQGTTFLRVSTTPDPYQQSGTGSADSAKLAEFSNYWHANHGAIQRAATMMLSGKQGLPNSASGIAWVNSLCEEDSGYSFTQVFKFVGSTASNDVRIVAHENGHNFGSLHTHCYLDPTPIDMCYNQQGGCYAGATSCPTPMTINGVTNVTGTLMSYCHLLGGCSAKTVFHPRTVATLDPILASKVGECVFPASGPQEASPANDLRVDRTTGNSVIVLYTPACGATDHTLYGGNLATLHSAGIAWNQRHCFLGTSGSASKNVGSGNVYFVVAGNKGSIEGSYGQGSAGERPPAGAGPGCQYTQDLSGTCP